MCGRYTLQHTQALAAAMAAILGTSPEDFRPRYNVSPSQINPVIKGGARPTLAAMRWGLVPFWDKSPKPRIMPINARSEEITAKPMFKLAVRQRRCAVPADGYYEWKRLDERTKVPHFIGLKGGAPFFIAGIYEDATDLHPATYALLTCGPNELMRAIHDRMPVILDGSALQAWLAAGEISVADLCVPYRTGLMDAWPVSLLVNSPRNDGPECVEKAGS